MMRGEGRNLQNMVLTAKGKEEMDGDPLIRLVIEVEKAKKNDQEIGSFHHFTNTIQKEAEVIYPSKDHRIIGIK